MKQTLVERALNSGGKLTPLIVDNKETGGLGLCNPSIYIDNEEILMNVRNVSYTLHHCEGDMKFQTPWGPLNYVRPDYDAKLRTTNFLSKNNNYHKVDTSEFDLDPIWDFVGLEDARIVRWDGKLYYCGCRRDVKSDGQSRMEMSEIKIEGNTVREVSRLRIPATVKGSYCEKNWMPILDMPYHFVKWTSPTEVVKVDPTPVKKYNKELDTKLTWAKSTKTIYHGESLIQGAEPRGSSQVITIGDYRMAVTHDCVFWYNEKEDRDAEYLHQFIVWDKDWNVVSSSPHWKFMNGKIEFCCGMAKDGEDILITFGYQDNSAFLLRLPYHLVEKIIRGE
tara:strand:- start:8684 stop:9691 length:1008 start_codon:yes stop_codon:yes gene_type:complete